MAAKIIDGTAQAARILEKVQEDVAALKARGKSIRLAAILIGDDSVAASYAHSQAKKAQKVGIEHRLIHLPSNILPHDAAAAIKLACADPVISGVMLHLPLPSPLDAFDLQQHITPQKDVEGVSAANLGLLAMGRKALAPCTAAAAFACLESTGADIRGKPAVVVGRSNIVGKPVAMLLLSANATVTQCHSQTRDLATVTRSAEVLIVAAGKAGLIGKEHVTPGAIVIDVGMHRVAMSHLGSAENARTMGDVRFEEVAPVASWITPVPGGVGPVTVAMLLANVVAAAGRI